MKKMLRLIIILMVQSAQAQPISYIPSVIGNKSDTAYENACRRINDLTIPSLGLTGYWDMNSRYSNKLNSKVKFLNNTNLGYDLDRHLNPSAALSSGKLYDCKSCKTINIQHPNSLAFWFSGRSMSIKYSIPDTFLLDMKINDGNLEISRLMIRDKVAKSGLGSVTSNFFNVKELSYEKICNPLNWSVGEINNGWHFIVIYIDSAVLGISIDGSPMIKKSTEYLNRKDLVRKFKEQEENIQVGKTSLKIACPVDLSIFEHKTKDLISDTLPFEISIQRGKIDDMVLFNREITVNEISGMYNNDFSDETKNIISEMHQKHFNAISECMESNELIKKMEFLRRNHVSFLYFIKIVSQIKGERSKVFIKNISDLENIKSIELSNNIKKDILQKIISYKLDSLHIVWNLYVTYRDDLFSYSEILNLNKEFRKRVYELVYFDLIQQMNKSDFENYINRLQTNYKGFFLTKQPILEALENIKSKEGRLTVYFDYFSVVGNKYIPEVFNYQGVNINPFQSINSQILNFNNNQLAGLQESINNLGLKYQVYIEDGQKKKEILFRQGDSIIVRNFLSGTDFYTYEYLNGENITLSNLNNTVEAISIELNGDSTKFRESTIANQRILEIRSAKERLEALYANNIPKDIDVMIRIKNQIERTDRLIYTIDQKFNELLALEEKKLQDESNSQKSGSTINASGKVLKSREEIDAMKQPEMFIYLIYLFLPRGDDDYFMKLINEEIPADPKGISGEICGKRNKKCDWCPNTYVINRYYVSKISGYKVFLLMDLISIFIPSVTAKMLADGTPPEIPEMMKDQLPGIRKKISEIKRGDIYTCEDYRLAGGVFPVNPTDRKYCSKKCEHEARLYGR